MFHHFSTFNLIINVGKPTIQTRYSLASNATVKCQGFEDIYGKVI